MSHVLLTAEAAQQIEEALVRLEQIDGMYSWADSLDVIRAARAQADHIAGTGKVIGCAYCDNPLFAGTKCNNCGRVTLAEQAEQEPEDIKLPVDVTIGCGTIKAGCSLQTLLTRIEVINHTWAPKLAYALNTPQLQAYQDKPFCMSDQATPRAKPVIQEPVHEALQIASVALQDIACSSQTENLYWWQLRAREAQKQIAELLTSAAPQPTQKVSESVTEQEPVCECHRKTSAVISSEKDL